MPGQIKYPTGQIWSMGRMFDTPALDCVIIQYSKDVNKFHLHVCFGCIQEFGFFLNAHSQFGPDVQEIQCEGENLLYLKDKLSFVYNLSIWHLLRILITKCFTAQKQ